MESQSRSQSPIRAEEGETSIDDDVNVKERDMQEAVPSEIEKSKGIHLISLSNFPTNWNPVDVKKFISGTVNSKHVTENLLYVTFKKNPIPNAPKIVTVKFSNKEAAEEACEQLKDVEMNGKKLCPKMMPFQPKKEFVKKPNLITQKPNIQFRYKGQDKNPNIATNAFQPKFNKVTYGLNIQFLQNLGIKPPLTSRIFIKNLPSNVDEKKIDEVFGLAGKIVNIYLFRNPDGLSKGMACVMYDHPVEAVQAISMFNQQSLFGSPLTVRLDAKKNYSKVLPEGLDDVGPGLGEQGKPLHYVRAHVEIEQIKHDIREWMLTASETNKSLNMSSNLSNANNAPKLQQPDLRQLARVTTNAVNFGNLNPSSGGSHDVQTLLQCLLQQANLVNLLNAQSVPSFMPNLVNQSANQALQVQGNQPMNALSQSMAPVGFSQNTTSQQVLPNTGPFQGIINGGSSTNPVMQLTTKPEACFVCGQSGHAAGSCRGGRSEISHRDTYSWSGIGGQSSGHKNQMSSGPGNMPRHRPNDVEGMMLKDDRDNDFPGHGSDMVVFRHLPSSVSIEALKNKMQEVGDVKFADLTGRGKAIVRFHTARQAEKCISLFDKSRVDGHVIEVHYV